jgi:carbonic anhydrase
MSLRVFCDRTGQHKLERERRVDMSEQSALERLMAGVRKFHDEVYAKNAKHYQRAGSTPQAPHTLIIGCADSRVDLEAITSSGPGEIFVARNVGNMVPPYSGTPGGVTAVIEYAVAALKVRHVVVCGHSDCGAMKALLHPPETDDLPTVRYWLHHGQAALMVADGVAHKDESQNEKLKRLTEENVLMQLVHMMTHPSVAGAMARGDLTMSGWVYDIGSGVVRIASEGRREFVPVTAAARTAA